ncbi:MAG: manganese-binding transcriptional regulator MntR [Planctomycetota bacterium]|nr:manganese-binding transcriptional regulator MntR [Planctomycetota bacterium]
MRDLAKAAKSDGVPSRTASRARLASNAAPLNATRPSNASQAPARSSRVVSSQSPAPTRSRRRPRANPDGGSPNTHRETRRAHAGETAEDYVEAIAGLIERQGKARVVDVARAMGVSHVTVVRTVSRLQREGLLVSEPYRSITLTSAGRTLAENAFRRHVIVYEFLRALGISEDAARVDSEGIEHHACPETLLAFARFARQAGKHEVIPAAWLDALEIQPRSAKARLGHASR